MSESLPPDTAEALLRFRRGLENIVFECQTLERARRIARAALQELTLEEAAKEMGISRQRLHVLIKESRIKSRRAKHFRLIPRSEVQRYRTHLPKSAERRSSFYAVKKCAEWLSYCLRLGWAKSDIDELEALWWQLHDENGNLVASAK